MGYYQILFVALSQLVLVLVITSIMCCKDVLITELWAHLSMLKLTLRFMLIVNYLCDL